MIKPLELDSEDNRGVWEVLTASADGDVATLRHWLAKDVRLCRAEYWYLPALHFAVREGHHETAQLLLDAGADPEGNGWYGVSFDEMARERGHEDTARVVEAARLRRGRVQAQPADHPIHLAAIRGDAVAVRTLLDGDPQLANLGDHIGGTALHRAVLAGSQAVVTLLLDRGANVHTLGGGRVHDVQPIDVAIWGENGRNLNRDMAALLVSRGATYDVTIAAALGDAEGILRMLNESPARIQEARPRGKRPLSTALEFGHDEIVRLLLERGADPKWDEPDAPHGTALHAASTMGNLTMVQLLLEHGADPNEPIDSMSSPITFAATREIRDVIAAYGGVTDWVWDADDDAVIRRIKADPEASRSAAWAFTSACTMSRRELLPRLFDAGLRVPDVLTVCQGYLLQHAEMLRTLLARGMNPNVMNWLRQTLLHLASSHDNRIEQAAMLLDAGADITARDEDYRSTPLAWAARQNAPKMVEFLLSRGAPLSLPDDEPWATPMAWATRRSHQQVVGILRAAGAE